MRVCVMQAWHKLTWYTVQVCEELNAFPFQSKEGAVTRASGLGTAFNDTQPHHH